MRITAIEKEYTIEEAISADAYVPVDSKVHGTRKMKVSSLTSSSGGYGEDFFIVNFTLDTNSNYVADKTHYEIQQWYDAHGVQSFNFIKGVCNGLVFNLTGSPGDHQTPWTFTRTIIGIKNGVPAINYAILTLSNTNEVTLTIYDKNGVPCDSTVPESALVVITPNVKADGGLSLTSEGSAHITEKTGLSFELPFVQLKQEPWNNTSEKVGLSFEISYLSLEDA